MSTDSSSRSALRIPTFRRLWVALVIFNLGHLVQVVASSWLILEMTGSPLWVSLMVGAPTLPLLVFSVPAGAAADLFDRRRILIVSSVVLTASSVAMSVLWGIDAVTPLRLVLLGCGIGVGIAFFNPAWHAIVPSLVPTETIPAAVSLNSATGGIATAVGPALGGVLIAAAGPGWSYAAASLGYTAVLVATVMSRPIELSHDNGSMAVAIATGLRYLRFSRDYLWLLLLGSLLGFTAAALRSMLPNLTSDVLGGGSRLYGLLLGLFGVGAIAGGLTRGSASRWLGRWMIPLCIIGYGGAGVVVGVSTLVAVTAVAMTVGGVFWIWLLATLTSIYQMLTPDWVRGRTMGAFVVSIFGFLPIGAIAAGLLGDVVGADRSLVIFSAAVVAIGLAASRMPIPVLEQISPPVMHGADEDLASETDDEIDPVMVITTWTVDDDRIDDFVDVLAELRLIRLRTGAHQWRAYRDASRGNVISEVFRVHSRAQQLQQQRRLDTDAVATIRRADGFDVSASHVRSYLVAIDVDRAVKRPGGDGVSSRDRSA
jgi:predicted MFS family arabinose efflux permease